MGKVLYLDTFAGIAGDMTCAALLHLGASLDRLREQLRALPVTGYELSLSKVDRGAFTASYFLVAPLGTPQGARPDWSGQPARYWTDIRAMLLQAELPERARRRALDVFEHLALAESRVHGVPPERIHFHEVGAVDSIVDIVGSCLLLEQLDVARIVAGPAPMGRGTIQTAHGAIPLPVPATVEALAGWPVVAGVDGLEQVTPTGAALLAVLAEPGPIPPMRLLGVGYGAGTSDPPALPNVLRAMLGDDHPADSPEQVFVLSAQMDDLSGELLPPLFEAVLAAGALDVVAMPVWMKKGRSGMLVQALCEPALTTPVELALLRHGSSFGVRRVAAGRRVLQRHHEVVETPWGAVRIKVGALGEEVLQASPEYEDVRLVASSSGQPVARVRDAALAAWTARRPEADP